ncbi:MAG: HlyD family efflux transporter periplasmic adaptor subunit [Panacagrimonas sp.]|nr:HlyD family efflux transporter periplasmic adaptor subunit [Panacagrimonas sp.]MCC2656344.1 HlyD family efflux transporter periplasmic adaptor subunit [Panacagrimonas sp.]
MRVARVLVLATCALAGVAASAHESGPAHHAGAPAATSADAQRPRRVGPDRLFVPKSVQHQLGLRTQPVADEATTRVTRLGEVLTHPDAPGAITAPEPGRLERADDAGWPVPGQVVRAGQTLAVLVPLMNERDRAQRRAALAVIDQKLNLARVNAARMRMQADARGGAPAADNLYLEQAEAELATQERIAALAREGLQGRVALRAPAAGVLGRARVQPGAIVAAADPLFEISGGGRARVMVDLYDARAASRLVRAHLAQEPGVELAVRGIEPHTTRPGWRALLDAPARRDAPLLPGALVEVRLELSAANDANAPRAVWVHVEPELFERRTSASIGDRVVVSGAALLDEYR